MADRMRVTSDIDRQSTARERGMQTGAGSAALGSPCSMADRMRVTSLIPVEDNPPTVPSKIRARGGALGPGPGLLFKDSILLKVKVTRH
jgi:hypothetical protein